MRRHKLLDRLLSQRPTALGAALAAGLGWLPGSAAAQAPALIDSAYAALDEGELGRARDLARRAVGAAPDDPTALIAQGRVYLAWPRVGRFQALEFFRRAARRAPDDPEAHYWIGRVGITLLGDDGEAIARRGLERALALDPHYRDAWDLWLRLYRGHGERSRMVDALRAHATDVEIRSRVAALWVEDGACELADSALAELEAERIDPRWPAWRAECAYVEGRDAEGWGHYQRAIALAAADSTGALWVQVASIARPDERAAYSGLPPEARAEFYHTFWAPRDPNVRTAENERIGEHFRRRARARDLYRLLHPMSLYHYSYEYRDWVSHVSSEARDAYVESQLQRGSQIVEALTSSRRMTARERALAAVRPDAPSPELLRLQELDAGFKTPDRMGLSPEILPLGRNLLDMIDDRGLVYIRHGPPARKEFGRPSERRDVTLFSFDVESWVYDSGPPLSLRFDRGWYPPDPPLPDMIHRPMTRSQAVSVSVAMTSERSSLAAPLEFGFWFARFKADVGQGAELWVFPDPELAATGVLWDGVGRELTRDSARPGGAVRLEGVAGRLLLALDVERGDSLGRYRGVVELPEFAGDSLALSDLLIARAGDARDVTRQEAAAAAIPTLSHPSQEPFLVYLEVYGLQAADGTHRFEVVYEFEQQRGWLARLLGGAKRIALRFERVIAARGDGSAVEAVRVDAGAIGPGRYELAVHVRDLSTGAAGTARVVALELLP